MKNTLEFPWKRPLLLKPFQNPTFINTKREMRLNPSKPSSPPQRCRFTPLQLPSSVQPPSRLKLYASEANPVASEEEDPTPPPKQKLGVVVKPMEKPRVVLKFIWMKRVIGVALDQVIPRRGAFPLTPYLFWPKEDAWEQLKALLESKPWISSKQSRALLNQAADIITLWQDNGGND